MTDMTTPDWAEAGIAEAERLTQHVLAEPFSAHTSVWTDHHAEWELELNVDIHRLVGGELLPGQTEAHLTAMTRNETYTFFRFDSGWVVAARKIMAR